jgi:hypothetical protein
MSNFVADFLYHGDFIAVGKFDAKDAIGPDFQGKFGAVDGMKAEFFKKNGLVGQGKDFLDFVCSGFLDGVFRKSGSDSFFLVIGMYGQGAYFGQVFPAELEGAAGDNFVAVFVDVDREIPQVVVEVSQRAGKEFSPVSVKL